MVVTHATQWSAVDATPLRYVAYYELIRKGGAVLLKGLWGCNLHYNTFSSASIKRVFWVSSPTEMRSKSGKS